MTNSASRSSRLRAAAAAITAIAAFSLVGCGASTGAVKSDAKKSSTTAAAPTTTEAPATTEAPTTTEEPATTAAPETTTASGGDWPEAAKQKFLESCEGGDASKTAMCECALRAIEPEISVSQLFDAGSTGSLPDDIQQKITDAATECALDPTSH